MTAKTLRKFVFVIAIGCTNALSLAQEAISNPVTVQSFATEGQGILLYASVGEPLIGIHTNHNTIVKEGYLPTMVPFTAEAEFDAVKIYPNPAVDYLTVDSFNDSEAIIYTFTGNEVLRVPVLENRVDIRQIPPGIYILKLSSRTQVASLQFKFFKIQR